MNHSILVKLQKDQIAVGSLIEKLMDLSEREREVGAIATFTGRVANEYKEEPIQEKMLMIDCVGMYDDVSALESFTATIDFSTLSAAINMAAAAGGGASSSLSVSFPEDSSVVYSLFSQSLFLVK